MLPRVPSAFAKTAYPSWPTLPEYMVDMSWISHTGGPLRRPPLGHSSVHIRELHLESSDILVLRHGCVIKSGTRGENIACLWLRLLHQPGKNTAVLHFLLHNGSHCQAGTHGLITFIISITYCLSEMLGSSDPRGSFSNANIHCSSVSKCLCTLHTGAALHRAQFIFAFRAVGKSTSWCQWRSMPLCSANGSSTTHSGRVGRFE